MAQKTIAEDITRLEADIQMLDDISSKQIGLKELEEGGAGSRFRTAYTDPRFLAEYRETLQTKVDTLHRGIS